MSETATATYNSVDDIASKLIEMLRDATKKPGEGWSANTTLQEAGIDSFDLIEYIFAIEDTFGIHIDFNANKKGEFPKTIGDVAQLVARLRNEVAAS